LTGTKVNGTKANGKLPITKNMIESDETSELERPEEIIPKEANIQQYRRKQD
jgi:hypothetical protein